MPLCNQSFQLIKASWYQSLMEYNNNTTVIEMIPENQAETAKMFLAGC